MELGLSLGDASKPFGFMEKSHEVNSNKGELGFCMGLSIGPSVRSEEDFVYGRQQEDDHHVEEQQTTTTTSAPNTEATKKSSQAVDCNKRSSVDVDPPIQLDLLPNAPVPRNLPSFLAFPWPSDNGSSEAGSSGQMGRGLDVNKFPLVEEPEDGAALSSSPNNSAASSFQMDFCIYSGGNKTKDFETSGGGLGNIEIEAERASSRVSDEDENGCPRKKLRLSKEQSAFLEESFKEHNTLNPKQKLALAKELNLRPRQVEVWFQNRRARTKLKQTEVDCEYLKRCCETLTEENRRLHKELQELRALKTSNPFHMQLPATTLTMCPSCERVATTNTNPSATVAAATSSDPTSTKATGFSFSRPKFFPFAQNQQPTTSRDKLGKHPEKNS